MILFDAEWTPFIRRKEEMNDIHIEGKAVGILRKI